MKMKKPLPNICFDASGHVENLDEIISSSKEDIKLSNGDIYLTKKAISWSDSPIYDNNNGTYFGEVELAATYHLSGRNLINLFIEISPTKNSLKSISVVPPKYYVGYKIDNDLQSEFLEKIKSKI